MAKNGVPNVTRQRKATKALDKALDIYANSNENSKGVAYPAINDKALYSAIIALPPLAEQHRIVAKLEELLPFCDQLRSKQN